MVVRTVHFHGNCLGKSSDSYGDASDSYSDAVDSVPS